LKKRKAGGGGCGRSDSIAGIAALQIIVERRRPRLGA
jgi:hypothetical protein